MVKLLIAHDSTDPELGTYFSSCFQDIHDHASLCGGFQVFELNSQHDETHLQSAIKAFQGMPFLFVAYTHGREDAIVLAQNQLVYLQNAYFFGESFVYTCACRVGQELADSLLSHNCRAFIGFSNDSWLPQADDYIATFRICENQGIKTFMEGEKTILESFQAMEKMYTTKFDELVEENAFAASTLLDNLYALVIKTNGSEHLTLADFS